LWARASEISVAEGSLWKEEEQGEEDGSFGFSQGKRKLWEEMD